MRLARPGVRGIVAGATAVLAVAAATGCGDSDGRSSTAAALGDRTMVDYAALPVALVNDEDRARYEAGSPERAFLNYWSSLQFGDWTMAVSFYEPRLRRLIGVPLMIGALRNQLPFFQGTKPAIVEVVRKGEIVSIRYAGRDLTGTVLLNTAAMRRSGGEWRIVYDSYLAGSLASERESEVQTRIDPLATSSSPEAVVAGREAGRLPAEYLDELEQSGSLP